MTHVHTFTDIEGVQRQAAYVSDCDQCGTYAGARTAPAPRTQDPGVMPANVHGEAVVSAFRHLPLHDLLDDTYTVITRSPRTESPLTPPRYCVFRARFSPALGRWSIDTAYEVRSGQTWTLAASAFAARVAERVS